MDVIEIRMAREAPRGAPLPMVLRGFVSQVHRRTAMTEQGPRRVVSISGQDYMKVLQIMRVFYLPTMQPGQDLLSTFKLFLNYSVDSSHFDTPAVFVKRVVDGAITKFLDGMRSGSGGKASPVEMITADATDGAPNASVDPFGVQEWPGGSIYDLLATFGDVGAWNELYMEDRDAGPVLVYRPAPFKTADGGFVQAGASAAEVRLTAADIIDVDSSRTDDNVANFYWVAAPRLALVQQPLLQLDQTMNPKPALKGYQNADEDLYGVRLMEVASNQLLRYDGKPEAEVAKGESLVIDQINEKRRVLVESNKDNVVLEQPPGLLHVRRGREPSAGQNVSADA